MFWLHVSVTSRHHQAVKRQSQFYNTEIVFQRPDDGDKSPKHVAKT
jgi:hypothetical protein